MVGLLTMKTALVAANCLDYTSGKTINTSATYDVRTSSLDDNPEISASIDPSQIVVHPNYNPSTLENNIAVLQFNQNTTNSYFTYVAANTFPRQLDVYIRRTIDSAGAWNTPDISNQAADSSDCAAASGLYASNNGWLSCTSTTTTSANSSSCAIPYGLIYGQESNNSIVLSSIYSHSVVYGGSMCDGKAKMLNYYTNLWPFVPFYIEVTRLTVPEYGNGESLNIDDTTINSMNAPSGIDLSGIVTVGGDLYVVQKDMADGTFSVEGTTSDTDSISSGDESMDSALSLLESSDSSSISDETQPNNNNTEARDGLTKGQKIAIGITIPFAFVLILVGSILIYNTWKAKRQDKAWDPISENLELQRAAVELDLGEILSTPPPYDSQAQNASNDTHTQQVGDEYSKKG
ncbi:hypothetical protein EV179_002385 [Coemansia sp. RSA 487]|nr:hypothetical protein EV179_002385 [Coemansia sp. RSA 487]